MTLSLINDTTLTRLKKLLYLLIIFFLFITCSTKTDWTSKIKSTEDFINVFPEKLTIEPEIYINDTINLVNPIKLRCLGDILLVKNSISNNGYFYSVFDLKTQNYCGEFLRRGKGPHEFIDIGSLVNSADSIIILDYYKQRLCLFSEESLKSLKSIPDNYYSLLKEKDDGMVEQVFSFEDKLIASGAFVNGRFCVYSKEGVLLNKFGKYPSYSYSDTLSLDHLGHLFGLNNSFCSNLDSSKIAFTSEYSINLYYYNKNNTFDDYFCVQWSSPAIAETGYKNGNPFVARWIEESYATSGELVSIGEYIVFPFSGLSKADIAKYGIEDYYKYLFVMDWEGNPIVRFSLDKAIKGSLIKDSSNEYLYSIHTDISSGFRQIVRLNIENLLDLIKKNEK